MFPCIEMAGTDLSKLYKGPLTTLTTHTTWKSLSLSHCDLDSLGSGARLVLQFLSESSRLRVGEQSSTFGMALYSEYHYAIHKEFVLGYLAMFLACIAKFCSYSSYISCLLRLDDLGTDIGSLCFRACLSVLPAHPKGAGPGGARVVTSYATMRLGYAGSFGYDGAPHFNWGRPQVVTALSVRQEVASRLAYSPTFGYSYRSSCKDETDWTFSSTCHSPRWP